MEILQTIWTALTNENELLIKINGIPCTFIEIYLYMLIILTVLKIDSSRKQKIIFVISFSVISLLNTYFGVMPYNTFINAISIPLLVLFIFKTSILKAILSEIIMFVTAFIFSTGLVAVYSALLGVSASVTSTILIHKICFSIIFYICLYLLYRLCKKFNINISLKDKFNTNKTSFWLILNLIIGSVAIGIDYFILFNYIDSLPIILVFLSLFVLLFYFALSIFSLIRTNTLEETKQLLEIEKDSNEKLTTLHDNIRGFKHDFNNIVQAIGGYLGTNNIDGLKVYYKDLLDECQINNNLSVLNPEIINNPAIYSLLCDKYCKAEALDIKFNIDVLIDLSNLNIKMYQLTRILGVLFDNAIEAASKCDKKIVNIIFKKDKNTNADLIIIQNTYLDKTVNIDKIFEKGYTSKTEDENNKSHGLGLWEVRNYLKKHTNLDLFTTKNVEYFTQQFEIFN